MDMARVLKLVCPQLQNPAHFLLPLNEAFRRGEMTTDLRQAMFIAQAAHETCEFKFFREVWGPTPAQKRYEFNEQLGNDRLGDGFRYRGRGFFQLTGRRNYSLYGFALGLPLEDYPDMVEDLVIGGQVAGMYWEKHKLNALADKRDIAKVTLAINGGMNGYPQRQVYYARALNAMRLTG
jgi:putative chitinase